MTLQLTDKFSLKLDSSSSLLLEYGRPISSIMADTVNVTIAAFPCPFSV